MEGTIPSDLVGTYFRNGPGLQVNTGKTQRHTFDGARRAPDPLPPRTRQGAAWTVLRGRGRALAGATARPCCGGCRRTAGARTTGFCAQRLH